MKIKVALPLLVAILVLSGCVNSKNTSNGDTKNESSNQSSSISLSDSSTSENSEKYRDYEEKEIEAPLEPLMSGGQSIYAIPVTYKKASFLHDSTTFDKDLAMLSFGLCSSSGRRTFTEAFYQSLDFDEIILNDAYSIKPTQDSVAYAIAHRVVAGYDLVAVSFRSNNYFNEWANNFELGSTGNHQGFERTSMIAFNDLDNYLKNNNYNNQNTKVWITGYSRGGALANMLASEIMTSKSLLIKEENLFVYTFEAPRAFSKANAINFPNVHNIINSADIVQRFAPEQYGLFRAGKEYDTYSPDVQEYLNEFDSNLVLPELNVDGLPYSNDQEHVEFILDNLLVDEDYEDEHGFNPYAPTREDFATKYQSAIVNAVNFYFSLSENTKANIQSAFSKLDLIGYLSLMAEDGFYNFIKPYFDADGVEYDDALLRATCNRLLSFVIGPGAGILGEAMSYSSNLQRMIYFHTFEVNYVLLKNFEVK